MPESKKKQNLCCEIVLIVLYLIVLIISRPIYCFNCILLYLYSCLISHKCDLNTVPCAFILTD